MLMLRVVQGYNKNLVCFPLNNLLLGYRDMTNGVGMPVKVVRLALAMASALAMALHYQNANAKGYVN